MPYRFVAFRLGMGPDDIFPSVVVQQLVSHPVIFIHVF